MEAKILELDDLRLPRPGLSSSYGSALGEAATVCLVEEQHRPGVVMPCDHSITDSFRLRWSDPPSEAFPTWSDRPFTTEQGAYGIAILVIEALTGMQVIEKSRKGTGFDYWLGPAGVKSALFQNLARLEVSGIRRGPRSAIDRRLKEKVRQTKRSDAMGISAYTVVVEFSRPVTVLETS